jgi:hypothetical protein
MSVLPLAKWVNRARKIILWVGFSWLPTVALLTSIFGKRGDGEGLSIGIYFLTAFFLPPTLVLSLIMPTYKSRIIVVPTVLIAILLMVSAGIGFSLLGLLVMMPWVATFTAVGLVIPQHSTVEYFFRQASRGGFRRG